MVQLFFDRPSRRELEEQIDDFKGKMKKASEDMLNAKLKISALKSKLKESDDKYALLEKALCLSALDSEKCKTDENGVRYIVVRDSFKGKIIRTERDSQIEAFLIYMKEGE